MATLGDDLRHIVEAGIGAVAAGVEEAGKVMDTFAQKGAPILNDLTRRAGVAADKVQQAIRDSELFRQSPAVTDILDDCRKLSYQELDELMDDLALLYAQKRDEMEQAEAAQEMTEEAPAAEPFEKAPDTPATGGFSPFQADPSFEPFIKRPEPEASAAEAVPVVAEPVSDPSNFFMDVPDTASQADDLQRKLDDLTRQLDELRRQLK